jgi:two-component system, NtrC family, sensor kinase
VHAELRLVDEQIERMRLIVNQLLQFARPREFAGYVESVDLPRLLDDCGVLVQHLLVRSRIDIRRDLAATRCAAVNRQELQQVLVNLMVNAAQAMPGGGELLLSTRDVDGPDPDPQRSRWVEIQVADTGPGLKPEIRAHLFQPFATGKQEGTGLGLWISRNLVERYDGEITAGDRPGGGACFTVRLPAAAD